MAEKTGIEWTDATWNPVTGCDPISPGCKHCYAKRDWKRLAANPHTRYYGREFGDVQCHGDVLDLPTRWQRPRRIFVNSMSDLFHPDVPFEFVAAVFGVMAAASWHTFQVLTKRPVRMLEFFRWIDGHPERKDFDGAALYTKFPGADWRPFFLAQKASEAIANHGQGLRVELTDQWPLSNAWIGVSVEDQAAADERLPLLLQTPAAIRFLSVEPMLGPIRLEQHGHRISAPGSAVAGVIDWVICGGESGPKARPMHPQWVRDLRDQCAAAGVPFLFKQWGEWAPDSAHGLAYEGPAHVFGGDFSNAVERVGKKAAGRLLDGVLHDGYPEV